MPKTGAYFQIDYALTPFQRVQALLDDVTTDPDYEGFDTQTLKDVRLISAENEDNQGRTVFELTVTKRLCNKRGTLHGGAASTLLDSLTSTTLHVMAKPGFLDAGHVGRVIAISYLRPVPLGMTVIVECEAIAAGRRMANVTGKLKTQDGRTCVFSSHDKAILAGKPTPKL